MTKPMNINFDSLGVEVEHHFSDKVAAKRTFIPAGVELEQHEHTYDHLSVCAVGRAVLHVDDGRSIELVAGDCANVLAGHKHRVIAITDVVWYCIHHNPYDTNNPEELDQLFVK